MCSNGELDAKTPPPSVSRSLKGGGQKGLAPPQKSMSRGRPRREASVTGSLLSQTPPSSSGAGMGEGSWVMRSHLAGSALGLVRERSEYPAEFWGGVLELVV